jgi:serralysin
MANNILPSVIETVDSTSTAPIAMAVGQTAQGVISSTLDYDYFTVGVVAGQKYSIGLIGTGISPMNNPVLRVLDSKGIEVSSNDDVAGASSGSYKWSELTYIATQTGNVTVKVESNGTNLGGQYGLSVTSGSQFNFDYLMGAGAVHSDTNSFWGSGNGQAATVTYGFRQTAASYTSTSAISTFTQLNTAEINAVRAVLGLWSEVCGIKFQEVNPGGYTDNATMLIGNYQDASDGAGAFAYKPSRNGNTSFTSSEGDIWLDRLSVKDSNLAQGSYGFSTIMHEIGHAIGLTHPGPYNAANGVSITYANDAKFVQDSGQYTVMSYFDGSNTAQSPGLKSATDSPMMFDILALQNLYGANMSTRTGNTIYGFGSNAGSTYDFSVNSAPQICIWDAGGSDTLNCSGYSQNQIINLTAGNFSNIGGQTSNVSIALNVSIENAVGGSGSDVISGNSLNNTIDGGSGTDTAIYSGTAATYTVAIGNGTVTLADKTTNRDGTDTLTNIERLKFSDTNIALDTSKDQTAGSGYMLYKAAFNRAPDTPGLGFWINKMDGGMSYGTVAQNFVNSAEFKTAFGGSNPSVNTLVTKLYNNVLIRNPDGQGLAFWQNKLTNDGWTVANVLGYFATSAENVTNVTPLIANGIAYQEWVG